MQFFSFLLFFIAVKTVFSDIGWVYFPFLILFLHCLLVAGITFWLGLEWWWVLIQALLPLILLVWVLLSWPLWLALAAFILLFGINGASLGSRVPYFPSARILPELILSVLPQHDARRLSVLDVGSGFGGVLLGLAARQPGWQYTGVEIALFPWLLSRLRVRLSGASNIALAYTDYRKLNLAEFDVVYAYLSPVVMSDVWKQAAAQMRPGSFLLSYEFPVGADAPAPDYVVPAALDHKELYLWQLK